MPEPVPVFADADGFVRQILWVTMAMRSYSAPAVLARLQVRHTQLAVTFRGCPSAELLMSSPCFPAPLRGTSAPAARQLRAGGLRAARSTLAVGGVTDLGGAAAGERPTLPTPARLHLMEDATAAPPPAWHGGDEASVRRTALTVASTASGCEDLRRRRAGSSVPLAGAALRAVACMERAHGRLMTSRAGPDTPPAARGYRARRPRRLRKAPVTFVVVGGDRNQRRLVKGLFRGGGVTPLPAATRGERPRPRLWGCDGPSGSACGPGEIV